MIINRILYNRRLERLSWSCIFSLQHNIPCMYTYKDMYKLASQIIRQIRNWMPQNLNFLHISSTSHTFEKKMEQKKPVKHRSSWLLMLRCLVKHKWKWRGRTESQHWVLWSMAWSKLTFDCNTWPQRIHWKTIKGLKLHHNYITSFCIII